MKFGGNIEGPEKWERKSDHVGDEAETGDWGRLGDGPGVDGEEAQPHLQPLHLSPHPHTHLTHVLNRPTHSHPHSATSEPTTP